VCEIARERERENKRVSKILPLGLFLRTALVVVRRVHFSASFSFHVVIHFLQVRLSSLGTDTLQQKQKTMNMKILRRSAPSKKKSMVLLGETHKHAEFFRHFAYIRAAKTSRILGASRPLSAALLAESWYKNTHVRCFFGCI